MIDESELRRLAAQNHVDPMVQDLDYALSWLLTGLFAQSEAAASLVFKGGTCLRKCCFADYRFSEDLDFTLVRDLLAPRVFQSIEAGAKWAVDTGGPDFAAAPARMEVISDDYGQESFQFHIYYRGPLRWGGDPRAIRIDVSGGEHLAFPVRMKRLHHPYSDAAFLPELQIPCYDLAEMLAEKVRAIGGQRRFAISRDLYDIHQLVQAGVSLESVRQALPAKLAAKSLDLPCLTIERLTERRSTFQSDWERRLAHLLPPHQLISFEAAWQSVLQLVAYLQEASN